MILRERFPLLVNQPDLVYLDSAATTQRPDVVLEAMDRYYRTSNANVHRGLYELSERSTELYEGVREKVRDFIGARSREEVIFTRGTTESLNMVAQGWGRQHLRAGDEIVLSILEHHSNIVPWQMIAERTGAVVKFCPITKGGLLDMEALTTLLSERTKIVSITGLSNTLGTVVPIREVVRLAHAVGAKVCLDAAQYAAHFLIDVLALEVDFLAFSSHKIYGPMGVGVLYGRREILESMDPWLGGGGMIREVHTTHTSWNDLPWKFEAGTPPIAEVIGLGAAIDFIKELGFVQIREDDRNFHEYALQKLTELPFVEVHGPKDVEHHRAVMSFTVTGVHPHDVSALLGDRGVCVRAGHHCTMPLLTNIGLQSTTRVSFGVYNETADVDRLVAGLNHVAQVFKL